jgi:hypothetical protein
MSENFESTYESSIPNNTITFTDSRVRGGAYDDFKLSSSNQDFWEDDGVSLTGNPFYQSDSISFSDSSVRVAFGNDHLTFNTNTSPVFNLKMSEKGTNSNGFWKYEEDKTLKEVEQYLSSTYHSHYTSETSKTQTLDLIESIGDAEAFTRSNAIKYLSRFGKKNGKSKQDILKAIHYCILLYHFAGLHKNNVSDYPY